MYDASMKSLLRLLVGLVVLTVAMLVSAGSTGPDGGVAPVSAQGVELSIDTDISDGPCTDIDSKLYTSVGQSFQVAVCIKGLGIGLAIVELHVAYDDAIILAPEVADEGPGLDDNPDANAGTTTWGEGLGDKTDCSQRFLAYPKGNRGFTPGQGEAFMTCMNLAGPWPMGENASEGPLAIITFNALKEGTSSLTLSPAVLGDRYAIEIGTCNPAVSEPMPCKDATIQVLKEGQTPPPESTAAASSEATPGATPGVTPNTTPKATPKATPEAVSEDGGNDWLWPTVIGIVAAVVVIGLLSLAFYRWRRGLAR
ncbi:MAG: hypothetical protein A2Y61_05150 [Chloroflexi bacterium RBG_13_60_13]|nr:MAG: hypothetical protein A2Y61_05150 [Chloroflexi bacterium RBG_13_60_13]